MTDKERLLYAIGDIDDTLIEEASLPYKRIFTPLTRGLTVAASVVIVSAVILAAGGGLLPKFEAGGDFDGNAEPPMDGNGSHGSLDGSDIISADCGYISDFRRLGEYFISFTMVIGSDCTEAHDIIIIGKNEETDELAICTTMDDAPGYSLVLSPALTVNGEKVDKLPSSVGQYFVTVDYSSVSATDYTWKSQIEITGFGKIN